MPKSKKPKEPVKIRTKKLLDGSESYYLDIYYKGKRSYEFLKLYHLPEISSRIKEQNRRTLEAVEAIKSKRILEIIGGEYDKKKANGKSKMLLMDWLETYRNEKRSKGMRGINVVDSLVVIVEKFIGKKKVRMQDIDKNFCIKYIEWLKNEYISQYGKKLSSKSVSNYVCFLSMALNAAIRAGVIEKNPFMSLSPSEKVKVPQSKREYLTIDELKTLIATDCPNKLVKQAYLFSCYCGLRISDLYRLKWKDISCNNGQWMASVVMQKTTTPIFLPLSEQARKWLPERNNARDDLNVFNGLFCNDQVNKILAEWVKRAGITKKITFHTSRHTFATMMLTLGADLYVTSKLLGHANVSTTQIYAKVIDSKKIYAVNLVDKVFD